MKKRAGILLVMVLSVILTGMRIWRVNQGIVMPEKREWRIGEIVPLADNYFLEEFEICEGYEVCVDEAKLLRVEDYLEKYGAPDRASWERENGVTLPEYVYDVTLTFYNTNKTETEGGIDLFNYVLCATDFTIPFCEELYATINCEKAGGSPMFSLRPDSEMTFSVPYGVFLSERSSYLNEKVLSERELYYVVSLYPVENRIRI